MGRKKKPFIDKKKAVKFHLVPRSQTDPLCGDTEQPQHVLKPQQPAAPLSSEDRLAQQRFYGVHYSDDYDYLQHLKAPGTAVMEPARVPSVSLPGGVFGSEVKIEGEMSKVLPVTGPQPDWDPDIVAGLDNPDMNFDLEDQLEDDFVLQANGGEPGIPVYVTDSASGHDDGGGGDDVWWMERGDFSVPHQHTNKSESTETDQSKHTETDQSDASSMIAEEGEDDNVPSKTIPNWCPPEGKEAKFTDYSISSSVVPRNKGLTELDERFEKFMSEYDDAELGAPEVEGGGGREGEGGGGREGEGGEQWLLHWAVRDFEKNFADKVNLVMEGEKQSVTAATSGASSGGWEGGGGEEGGEGEGEEGSGGVGERGGEEAAGAIRERQVQSSGDVSCSSDEGDEGGRRGEREEREMVMVEAGKGKWDCESILRY